SFSPMRLPPRSSLFPYTTLFRSLHVLLDAGVQIPDAGAGIADRFAVDLQDQAQHAVRRGMLRAHVDDHVVTLNGRSIDRIPVLRSEEHTSELQSREKLVCRLLLE